MNMMRRIGQEQADRPAPAMPAHATPAAAIPATMHLTRGQVKLVRDDLARRIGTLEARLPLRSFTALMAEIDAIRTLAQRHGFEAVACLARALESHLATGGGAAALHGYIDALHDAVALDPGFHVAQEALLASVSLRLDGCP